MSPAATAALRRNRTRGRPRLESRLEEVLTCAAALFSSRGYAATTLEDIGSKLGMSRPALYYYTKSKDDLLDQCYAWTHKRFLDRLNNELGDGSGRELLTRFFLIYSEMVCDNASRCFLSTDNHLLSEGRQQAARARVQSVNAIALDLLDKGVADASLAPCDRKYAITTLFGAFNALHNLVRPRGPTPFQMGSAILRILLNGLTPRN